MTTSAVMAGLSLAARPANQTKQIAEAAKQFEALLIGQMLKSAHGPEGESMMGSQDEPGSALLDMSAEQFAQTLADKGGLGMAKMIVAGLESHANR